MTSPFPPVLLTDDVATASSTRNGISVTSGAANTEGTAASIDASTSVASSGLVITLNTNTSGSATNTSVALRVKVGGVTRWHLLIGYLPIETSIYLPGYIAAGSAVTATAQATAASKLVAISAQFMSAGSPQVFSDTPIQIGTITTAGRGVTVTPHATAGTKGSWVELTASTSAAIIAMVVTAQLNGATVVSNSGILLDIGVGAVGSESVVLPDLHFTANTAEVLIPRVPLTYGVVIPAGSRIAVRSSTSIGGSAPAIDVACIGVPAA